MEGRDLVFYTVCIGVWAFTIGHCAGSSDYRCVPGREPAYALDNTPLRCQSNGYWKIPEDWKH